MKLDSLRTLYVHELNDLLDAENQLVKVLPKLVKAALSMDLRLAFGRYLEQTQEHVRRLAEMLDEVESAELLQNTLNDERATGESVAEPAERLIHLESVAA